MPSPVSLVSRPFFVYTPFACADAQRSTADYNYAHLSAPVANKICNDGTLLVVMVEDQAGLDCVE